MLSFFNIIRVRSDHARTLNRSICCSPGFPDGILGHELTDKFREQSVRFGTTVFTETVTTVDLSKRPFRIVSEDREVCPAGYTNLQAILTKSGGKTHSLVFSSRNLQYTVAKQLSYTYHPSSAEDVDSMQFRSIIPTGAFLCISVLYSCSLNTM